MIIRNFLFILISSLSFNVAVAQTLTSEENICESKKEENDRLACYIELYSDSTVKTPHAKEFRAKYKGAIDHHKMVKLEAECERKKGMVFYNLKCIKKEEFEKIRAENLEMEPAKRSLEDSLNDCPVTLEKLRKTEPRVIKKQVVVEKIKTDCQKESLAHNNSKRDSKDQDDSGIKSDNATGGDGSSK